MAEAVFPAVTSRELEAGVKQLGDRIRVLQFLAAAGPLLNYSQGTDMPVETLFDDESTLVISRQKAWNFPIDRVEEQFTYAGDIADSLVDEKSHRLGEEIDSYVLGFAGEAKAGSWIGYDMRVTGSAGDTQASVATTATGGTLTISAGTAVGNLGGTAELGDGTLAFVGFTNTGDLGKPVRLTSGNSWATEFFVISAVTDTNTVSITNWDEATAGSEIPNGDILRGLAGNRQLLGGENNDDGKPTTQAGWGWELQAAFATTLAQGTVYEQTLELDRRLNEEEVPSTDRHLIAPPAFTATLKAASEIIPAIQMAYTDVVLNGQIGKVSGFMLHEAAGFRVSTRLEHATSSGQGADVAVTAGDRNYLIPAWHKNFCHFAYKWSESRTVIAINQFNTQYQAQIRALRVERLARKLRKLRGHLFETIRSQIRENAERFNDYNRRLQIGAWDSLFCMATCRGV